MAQPPDDAPTSTHDARPAMMHSPNPLIHQNPADTVSATRAYVAEFVSSMSQDDQVERGRVLRLMIVLSALDSLDVEKDHHK